MTLEEAQKIVSDSDVYFDPNWGESTGETIVDGHPTLEVLRAMVVIMENKPH